MITVSDIEVDDFKDFFVRDFDYSIQSGQTESIYSCQKNYIMDSDITKSFREAKVHFNEGLFSTDDQLMIAFLYLSAHYLVNDLNTSKDQGGTVSQFPVSYRMIGAVSESYSIPEWVLKDPILSYYSTTRYGMKYISLVKPLLIGNVKVYKGYTTPW
jgi:hypothetical protein